MTNSLQEIMARTEWFRRDRFGMFIHWGLYSQTARDPWIKAMEHQNNEQYQIYFDEFNPTQYDPREWARLAKAAGMRYAVLTTKHHDGFCLFDSAYTDYKSTNTLCGRDLVREYLDAFRAEGLKVGLYYSLLDWHHPNYPCKDENHPLRNTETAQVEPPDFNVYLDYLHNQVRELCTNYGKIDIMWFDFSYADKCGDAWRARELVELVRGYQPQVLIDNRLETSGGGLGSIVTETPSDFCGDFVSPEMIIPPKGIVNYAGKPVPWESNMTINNNWGYSIFDKEYKTAKTIVRKLLECVSKGGNMLLDVGPNAHGCIDKLSAEALRGAAQWMADYGDSIYGCGVSEFEKPEWGRYTQNGNKVYAHILEQPVGPLALNGIPHSRIKHVKHLADGVILKRCESWVIESYPTIYFVSLGESPAFTYTLYSDIDTVLEITLKD